jgi:hypothetical protein
MFQSAVWLFGNHALDVGDTIMMPPDDTWYRVKKVGRVCVCVDGGRGEAGRRWGCGGGLVRKGEGALRGRGPAGLWGWLGLLRG